MSKLDEEKVLAMRRRRAEGAVLRELAAEFGVCIAMCSRVTRGIGWKWVGGQRTPRRKNGRRRNSVLVPGGD